MSKLFNQSSCRKWDELVHFKTKEQRRFFSKKKSMLATRVNVDNSKIKEETNMCLIAHKENEKVTTFEPCHLCTKMENDFDNLLYDSSIISEKCILLKEHISKINKEKEKLQILNDKYLQTIQELKKSHFRMSEQQKILNEKNLENYPSERSGTQDENLIIKIEVDKLENGLTKFIKSTKASQKIIGSEMGIFHKDDLNFKTSPKQKLYENLFESKRKDDKIKKGCSYCNKYGHLRSNCYHKKKFEKVKKEGSYKFNHPRSERSCMEKVEKVRTKCFYCNKYGHLESFCYHKKKLEKIIFEKSFHKRFESSFHIKSQWSQKVEIGRKICSSYNKSDHIKSECDRTKNSLEKINTNLQGPKSLWVPKSLPICDAGISSKILGKALILGKLMLKKLVWRSK